MYRTAFVTIDSGSEQKVVQVVLKKPIDNDMSVIKCAATDLQQTISQQKETPFSKPHLPHRFTIFETDTQQVVCMLEQHYALDDAASSVIFMEELSRLYAGQRLADPAIPYSDYISSIQNSSSRTTDENYWVEYLRGFSPCLLPPSNTQSINVPQLRSISLHVDCMSKITGFCIAHGTTIAILFKSLWAIALHLSTDLTDISFGYLVSTRNAPGIKADGAIGNYLNMLVHRIKITRDSKLGHIIQTISNDYSLALTHQFHSLDALNMKPSQAFSTLINHRRHNTMQNEEPGALKFKELEASDGMDVGLHLNMISNC